MFCTKLTTKIRNYCATLVYCAFVIQKNFTKAFNEQCVLNNELSSFNTIPY